MRLYGPLAGLVVAAASAALIPESTDPPVSCFYRLEECVSAIPLDGLEDLHQSIARITQPPRKEIVAGDGGVEAHALALFRELGLIVLAAAVDVLRWCEDEASPKCASSSENLKSIGRYRADLDSQLRLVAKDYVPGAGVRSVVLRVGRMVQSDLEGYAREWQGGSLSNSLSGAMQLAHMVGQRTRLFSELLTLHFWVRSLMVPGRSVPAFILHEDYTTWGEMLTMLIGNMVRNGLAALTLVDVGASPERDPGQLLKAFAGLQYAAAYRGGSASGGNAMLSQLAGFSGRANVIPDLAPGSLPAHVLDIVVISDGAIAKDLATDVQLWEQRIKPGGILAGFGFDESSPSEGVKAICHHRRATDIHIGIGGSFWWIVEPEE